MGSELPLPTRILIDISNIFKNIWFLLGAAIVIPVLSLLGLLRPLMENIFMEK